ncbi:MAG: GIY-YIG nuclease family protein [Microgenomates group bacterium]
MIAKTEIEKLPSTLGVYIFKNNGEYLYVGKSVNIKARVKSHFENAKLDKKEAALIAASNKIDYIVTDSEFKALLLEAELIKEHHPKYNVIWKDDKSFLYIKITITDHFPKVFLSRKKDADKKALYFGPFSSVKMTLKVLNEVRRIVPFCMDKRLKNGPCFYSKIGLCDPCPGAIVKEKNGNKRRTLRKIYYQNIIKLVRLLRGKIMLIINDFYRQLKRKIKEEKYEEAIILRDRILRLQSLEKRSFSPIDINQYNQSKLSLTSLQLLLVKYLPHLKELKRIECYDVSNLAGEDATASMVVLTDGQIDKTQYRKFRIKNLSKKSDPEMLEEVFKRRFSLKNNWPYPNLIVVDGGRPQVRLIKNVLQKLNQNLPVIGIAKNPDRLVMGTSQLFTIKPPADHPGFNLIRLIRDESHRFARKYHLLLRKKAMMLG